MLTLSPWEPLAHKDKNFPDFPIKCSTPANWLTKVVYLEARSVSISTMKTYFAVVLGLGLVGHVLSICNVCLPDKRACISETEVALCDFDFKPTNHTITCAAGHVCDFDATCRPIAEAKMQGCICNKCNAEKIFACTGYNTFALCLGKDMPQEVKGKCDEGFVCNMNDPQICTPEENGSSCSGKMEEPPPPPTTNPGEYCKHVQKKERFPLSSNTPNDCKQYVYCFQSGTEWLGAIYYCSGGTYFHDHINGCKAEMPARCSPRIFGLYLQ